jgi:hypothetical protein
MKDNNEGRSSFVRGHIFNFLNGSLQGTLLLTPVCILIIFF